jgi:hypothetical protein
MKQTCAIILVAMLLIGLTAAAMAQDQTCLLKDYMPQTVGSKWIMKTTNQQGETTNTIEVGEPREIAGQQALPMLTKDAQGNVTRGTIELATDNAYYLFGSMRGPRGQQGGEVTTTLYDPMVVFPAKLAVGQEAEAKTKLDMRGQPTEVTMKVKLEALESVTVAKGTFDGCLKLVYTTVFGDRSMARTVWYAKGIGLIKTEQPGFGQNATPRVAELLDYLLAPAQ